MKDRFASALQASRNRSEWKDQSNWSFGFLGIYSSARDSRLIVPKRNPALGWTINFGHSAARWIVLGVALIPLLRRIRR